MPSTAAHSSLPRTLLFYPLRIIVHFSNKQKWPRFSRYVIDVIFSQKLSFHIYKCYVFFNSASSIFSLIKLLQTTFGERLVSRFLFESDFGDDPQLPSPNQLQYRVLIKNKKMRVAITPALPTKIRVSHYHIY